MSDQDGSSESSPVKNDSANGAQGIKRRSSSLESSDSVKQQKVVEVLSITIPSVFEMMERDVSKVKQILKASEN